MNLDNMLGLETSVL